MSQPDIQLNRGGNQSWMPNWNTSSPSAPDITNFLMAYHIKEGGNYGVDEVSLTLINETGGIVGVFTNTSQETVILPSEYFRLRIDDGNVSKVYYGYFGNLDSRYTDTPPNSVTFQGNDLRIEQTWRTISYNYNVSTGPMNASDSIAHMHEYPDDSPDGTYPLEFIINVSGSGLNDVVPESNFENAHPNIFKATAEILQRAGYEQKFTVNANGSKILEYFPAGASYHSPNISFVAKGLMDITNNAVRIKNGIDYDDIANIIGVWAQDITQIPVWDEWTDDTVWWGSAWNCSRSDTIFNFSCWESQVTLATWAGMNTSYGSYASHYVSNGPQQNLTTGIHLDFPSYTQSTALQLDSMNAQRIRFMAGCFEGPATVVIRMTDVNLNTIENVDVITGPLGIPLESPKKMKINQAQTLKWFEWNVNKSTRTINNSTEADGDIFDWYYVNRVGSENFSFDNVRQLTFICHANKSAMHFAVDYPLFTTNFKVSPREASELLPLAQNQSSIDVYHRRFLPIEDNRIRTVADALLMQSTELQKRDEPVRRLRWRTTDALHATPGLLATVDCPPYGIHTDHGNEEWRVLQVQHDWKTGEPNYTTVELVWPATPSSPSQDLNNLRLGSFDQDEVTAGLISDLRDRIARLPRGVTGAGAGTVVINQFVNAEGQFDDVSVTNLSFQTGYGETLNVSTLQVGVTSSLGVYAQSASFNNIIGSTGRIGNLSTKIFHAGSATITSLVSTNARATNFSVNTLYSQALNSSTVLAGVTSSLGVYAQSANFNNLLATSAGFNSLVTSSIRVDNLSAQNIYTDSLDLDSINASDATFGNLSAIGAWLDTVNASDATFGTVTSPNASIDTLESQQINVSDIATGGIIQSGDHTIYKTSSGTGVSIESPRQDGTAYARFYRPDGQNTVIVYDNHYWEINNSAIIISQGDIRALGNWSLGGVLNVSNNVNVQGTITADDLVATNASIGTLESQQLNVSDISVGIVAGATINASGATIDNLSSINVYGDSLNASDAVFGGLIANVNVSFGGDLTVQSKLTVEDVQIEDNLSAFAIRTTDINASKGMFGNLSSNNIYGNLFQGSDGNFGNVSVLGLWAQSASFDYVIASTARIGSMSATTINVGTLNADSLGLGDNVVASSIRTYNLSAQLLHVTSAEIDNFVMSAGAIGSLSASNAYIATLTVDTFAPDSVNTSDILVGNLTSDLINTSQLLTDNISATTGYIATLNVDTFAPDTVNTSDILVGNLTSDFINTSQLLAGVTSSLGIYAQSASLNNLISSTGRIANLSTRSITNASRLISEDLSVVSNLSVGGDVIVVGSATISHLTVLSSLNLANTNLQTVNHMSIADQGENEGINFENYSTMIHHPTTAQGGYDAFEIRVDDPFQIRDGTDLLFQINNSTFAADLYGDLTIQSRFTTQDLETINLSATTVNTQQVNASDGSFGGIVSVNVSSTNIYGQNFILSAGRIGNLSATQANIATLSVDTFAPDTINTSDILVGNLTADLMNTSQLIAGITSSLGIYAQSASLNNLISSTGRISNLSTRSLTNTSLLTTEDLIATNASLGTLESQQINVSDILVGALIFTNLTGTQLDLDTINVSDIVVGGIEFVNATGTQIDVQTANISDIVVGAIEFVNATGTQIDVQTANISDISVGNILFVNATGTQVNGDQANFSDGSFGGILATVVSAGTVYTDTLALDTLNASDANVGNLSVAQGILGNLSIEGIVNISANQINFAGGRYTIAQDPRFGGYSVALLANVSTRMRLALWPGGSSENANFYLHNADDADNVARLNLYVEGAGAGINQQAFGTGTNISLFQFDLPVYINDIVHILGNVSVDGVVNIAEDLMFEGTGYIRGDNASATYLGIGGEDFFLARAGTSPANILWYDYNVTTLYLGTSWCVTRMRGDLESYTNRAYNLGGDARRFKDIFYAGHLEREKTVGNLVTGTKQDCAYNGTGYLSFSQPEATLKSDALEAETVILRSSRVRGMVVYVDDNSLSGGYTYMRLYKNNAYVTGYQVTVSSGVNYVPRLENLSTTVVPGDRLKLYHVSVATGGSYNPQSIMVELE